MKVIKTDIDANSIDKAIAELEDYREEINNKFEQFVETLIQGGVSVAGICVAGTQGDSKLPDVTYEIDSSGEIINASICLIGSDVLFVEFGAGIAYNTGMQHPKAAEFGYGIGTYPSKHPPNRAINPGYWYYTDHDSVGANVSTLSIGTEATMPMYHAAESMRNECIQKALDVFRS